MKRLLSVHGFACAVALLTVSLWSLVDGEVLNPPYFNLAESRKITATATCGEKDGRPIRELYCFLAGATRYSPFEGYYSYNYEEEFSELRISGGNGREHYEPLVQGGQNCEYCDASNPELSHPPENMVDGTARWWQSPPLSRGMEYNQINITIDLEQEFHVAYVSIQMANSPRPGLWVLERSNDFGKTFKPWQYFAENPAQCEEFFGPDSLQPILDDDSVVCSTEYSQIVPLENGQIFVTLVNNRPGRNNFSHSDVLQNYTRATNVRLRLLRTKTLQGHLMDLNDKKDPTITRRYFYSIKEIEMGGRCVCNGHAQTCDILDQNRPTRLLCRCEHNTCGDHCDHCCPGYEQKKWQPAREGQTFVCEPCNCFGHAYECAYDPEVDARGLSLDVHKEYRGGGVCKNCMHNTEGINCNRCKSGYYRPYDREMTAYDACEPCDCDRRFHINECDDGSGRCHCRPEFAEPECAACSPGYYDYPECKPCDCFIGGTKESMCLPQDGQCPCKENFAGIFCNECAVGYYGFPNCTPCLCDLVGSMDNHCNRENGQCSCKINFKDLSCDQCADGYYGHPSCDLCNCETTGAEPEVCNKTSGECICKRGFAGERCDRCDVKSYGYPNCKDCNCTSYGSLNDTCHPTSGQCQCKPNFSGRQCSKCSVGHYNYPECLACNCDRYGSKGVTCDRTGQCFCKANFEGQKCNRCMEGFYNFPLCEDCNCDPRGVSLNFGGCDRALPGELCSCRENVQGRRCNECKPLFWNLQYYNPAGCEPCGCSTAGTVSNLTDCDATTGQCHCKVNVAGTDCARCKDGFYNLQSWNHFGCQPCQCDRGGSFSQVCDHVTGQCYCKPRVNGKNCSSPIESHYFPTLHQLKYEVEEGVSANFEEVRYAVDEQAFPNFSWKGYVVFSPIQPEVYIPVEILKSHMYRVLVRYINPSTVDVNVEFEMEPVYTYSVEEGDVKQKVTVKLPRTSEPASHFVTSSGVPYPFVMNPGRWYLIIRTPQRLYMDYVVLIPDTYYEGTNIRQNIRKPCLASNTTETLCEDVRYPEVTYPTVTYREVYTVVDDQPQPLQPLMEVYLPDEDIGMVNTTASYLTSLPISEPGHYMIVIDYRSFAQEELLAQVEVTDGDYRENGLVAFHYCPYSSPCRDLVSREGQPVKFFFNNTSPAVTINPVSVFNIGLKSISAVPADQWTTEYLYPKLHCVRQDGKCIGSSYLTVPSTAQIEVEAQYPNASFSTAEVPFTVDDREVKLLPLYSGQEINISGAVPKPDKYVFVVHYYAPNHAVTKINATLRKYDSPNETRQDEEGTLKFRAAVNAYFTASFCPSVSGCRALIQEKTDGAIAFSVLHKFVLSFALNESQNGSVYVDYVLVLPLSSYSEDILMPISVESSEEYVKRCSEYIINPRNSSALSDFCRRQIFSLTVDYNVGALSCDCNLDGSTSLNCEQYGGQCNCKENVIGRQCSDCRPGYYGFPDCKPCHCGINRICDSKTGQCNCPLHVEGIDCDVCKPFAFGYDTMIGCQECGCSEIGTVNASLNCDPITGQCKCKSFIGGRKCDTCLSGYYGYPHCFECACDTAGTIPDRCDQNTAACLCKGNVIGSSCASCAAGTFYLEEKNPKGCTECFCFGTTSQCESSSFRKGKVTAMKGWSVHTPAKVNLLESDDAVAIECVACETDDGAEHVSVYLTAPKPYLGKKLLAHGGRIRYQIAAWPAGENSVITISPEVVLKGHHNITLEHWSDEQPPDPQSPFDVEVDLHPESWIHDSGERVTRAHLLMVLNNLTAILVKASYYNNISRAVLKHFTMETALNEPAHKDEAAALSVEVCRCPPPYRGTSCEDCANGYYRVHNTPLLGSCVPCQCNGHSNECDPETGICVDCDDNTVGDHCEMCAVGYYGDATKGTSADCRLCPCPIPTVDNNFALNCSINDQGTTIKCHCQDGYTGARCERCANGWFGQPLITGGHCEPCFCNSNNDLSLPNSCHPETGVCYRCLNFTAGDKCETCEEWSYGDAVEAKNCRECDCDRCGSTACDGTTGQCTCHQNVIGPNCSHCQENTWGFSYCRGCQACDCDVASVTQQCNVETGECQCQPGAAGPKCDRCADGYWNYSAQGCRKCDCESDRSVGTVCDVHTGQCQCMEGAIGARCDQCIEHYLNIPLHGCLYCDECVEVLLDTVKDMSKLIDGSNEKLKGMSTSQLHYTRLNRFNESVQVVAHGLHELTSEAAELLQDKNDDSNVSRRFNVRDVVIKASRLKDNSVQVKSNAGTLAQRALTAYGVLLDMAADLESVAEKLKALTVRLEVPNNVENSDIHQHLIRESTNYLSAIETTDLNKAGNITKDGWTKAEEALKKVNEFEGRLKSLFDQSSAMSNAVEQFHRNVAEMLHLLTESLVNAMNANETLTQLVEHPFYSAQPEAGLSPLENTLNEASQVVFNASKMLEVTEQTVKDMRDKLNLVNKTDISVKNDTAQVSDIIDQLMAARSTCAKRAKYLIEEAERLEVQLAGTQVTATDAVSAANAYKSMKKALESAEEAGNQMFRTQHRLTNAVNLSSIAEDVLESRRTAVSILRQASDIRKNITNDLRNSLRSGVEDVTAQETLLNESTVIINNFFDHVENLENVSLQIEAGESRSSQALTEATDYMKPIEAAAESCRKLNEQSSAKITDHLAVVRIVRNTKVQADQLGRNLPALLANLTVLRNSYVKSLSSTNSIDSALVLLREKLEHARNLANRVKIGAKFFGDSSLQLRNPDLSRTTTESEASLYFKTDEPEGLLLFVGNEKGTASKVKSLPSDDYFAVEVSDGRLKYTYDLGAGETSVYSNRYVADNRWHMFSAARVGKSGSLTVETDGEELDKVEAFNKGAASILNVVQNASKVFVGGVPPSFQLPNAVSNRHFVGNIEGFSFNNERRALWNFELDGKQNVQAAKERKEAKVPNAETGVSFNGQGYLVMKRGTWNPREVTRVSLRFKTYSTHGLLFFIGKDRDFFAIEIRDGQIQLNFDLGSGRAILLSPRRYNDGLWHRVFAERELKEAKLLVDMWETVQGESKNEMAHLDVTDEYYVGGMPPKPAFEKALVIRQGFFGCIEQMQLNGVDVDLTNYVKAVAVERNCPDKARRIVSFNRHGGSVKFSGITLNLEVEVTFRFRTNLRNTWLMLISDDTASNTFAIALQDGHLVMKSQYNKAVSMVQITDKDFGDGLWHYVTGSKHEHLMRLDVDDTYNDTVELNSLLLYAENQGMMHFGSVPAVDSTLVGLLSFVGCIGDVVYNGRALDFAHAARYGEYVSFDGCPDNLFPTAELVGPTEGLSPEEEAEFTTQSSLIFTTIGVPTADSCALQTKPLSQATVDVDGSCYRFGIESASRLEYEKLPSAIDAKSEFTMSFRASAFSGVLFYATDRSRDFIILYLKNGKLIFGFDSGSGAISLESRRSLLDYQWHQVKVSRVGKKGQLWVNDILEAEGESHGATDRVETTRPFFVGGLPVDLYRIAENQKVIDENVAPVFAGCIKDLKLNDELLGEPSTAAGTVPCSEATETGLYFGENAAYAIVQEEVKIGSTFSFNMEIKSRVRNCVLLAISSRDGSDYLTLQVIDGALIFTVNNGAGPEQVKLNLKRTNLFCDGHWHTIRIYKVKNFLTVGVDNINSHTQMKKRKAITTDTKDPLYLGGVPTNFSSAGLLIQDHFIGCIRSITFGKLVRRRENVVLDKMQLFGDISKDGCPVD